MLPPGACGCVWREGAGTVPQPQKPCPGHLAVHKLHRESEPVRPQSRTLRIFKKWLLSIRQLEGPTGMSLEHLNNVDLHSHHPSLLHTSSPVGLSRDGGVWGLKVRAEPLGLNHRCKSVVEGSSPGGPAGPSQVHGWPCAGQGCGETGGGRLSVCPGGIWILWCQVGHCLQSPWSLDPGRWLSAPDCPRGTAGTGSFRSRREMRRGRRPSCHPSLRQVSNSGPIPRGPWSRATSCVPWPW